MKALFAEIDSLMPTEIYGRVTAVQGLLVEIAGPIHEMSVGSRLLIDNGEDNPKVPAEVVGFAKDMRSACRFPGLKACAWAARPSSVPARASCIPGNAWLGRVVNALGEPIDGKGADLQMAECLANCEVRPPPASERAKGWPAA